MPTTRSRQCAAAAGRRACHSTAGCGRGREGTLVHARVARNPEDDVALFGKRDSTLRVFIRPKVLFTPRKQSASFEFSRLFVFLRPTSNFRIPFGEVPKQKPRSVIEPARSDFVSRVPTALDYLSVQEREVRCFSPKVRLKGHKSNSFFRATDAIDVRRDGTQAWNRHTEAFFVAAAWFSRCCERSRRSRTRHRPVPSARSRWMTSSSTRARSCSC